ncbi:TetR/AcrR family transcriptional regulator [Frankia sp. CNm7]|uniref:TetR/AcrR family transcriptional regulator n=1 Tax=Frankia nepalensis TaxID=1836974 RepID=A0A937RRF7_9ACTN|nr:TetR/AcrR family transcriptional regulator [Frankia nepalensis]MBL7495493.1 TetR/AcrR family transcriptional regulator [Frankia nepalensis]MBL7510861.1 TetR/AcrR family transcriptional regulator [Frankia nepalensis]MBL7520395.1 TetR/AcrR family transcriptional regulator [Frankia nepalensis]MBL7630596.1 TetR/AcrR family transcriptional regulator [Frankia nepalensis]
MDDPTASLMVTDGPPQRGRLLALIADYILEHGVSELTLRALAAGVGSNNRMLLYYFGSKERLMAEGILEAVRRFPRLATALDRLSADDRSFADHPLDARLHQVWLDIAADENEPFLRLFFELFGLAAHQPDRYGMFLTSVADWAERVARVLALAGAQDEAAREIGIEVVALWRGLQFALLSGTPRAVLDRAHATAARAVADRVAAGGSAATRLPATAALR